MVRNDFTERRDARDDDEKEKKGKRARCDDEDK